MAARATDRSERTFSTSFRGFDPSEVRAHLRTLEAELDAARDRIADLEHRLVMAAPAGSGLSDLDEAEVAARLGDEAARVLRTAREAAAEMRTKAAEHMDRQMREAQDDAARMRAEADVEAARRREAAAVEAAAEVERAKAEGRRMIAEAQAVRERMMADLSRRRDVGRRQIAQLADGRDRLLAAYEHVRRSLDEVSAELAASVPEAQRLAGDALGRSIVTNEDLVLDAALVGRPVVAPAPPAPADAGLEVVEPEPADDASESVAEAVESDDIEQAEQTEAIETAEVTVFDGELVEDVVAEDPVLEDAAVESAAEAAAEVEATVDDAEPVAGHDDDPSQEGTAPEPIEIIDLTDGAAERAAAEPVTGDDGGERGPAGSVDDLFARLRAARSESVAHAVEVLSADAPGLAFESVPPATEATVTEATVAEAVVSEQVDAVDGQADDAGGSAGAAEVFAARKAATELLERSVARHLKRALADEQNEVLERLRHARRMPAVEELLGELTEHAERYRSAVADDLRSVAIAGARSAGADERAAERFANHAKVHDAVLAEVAMELTGLVRDRVGRCLEDGEGDPDEAAHQLRAAYREMKVQRLDGLAAHFTVSAYARGAFAAIPADAGVCWLVDPDGPACADAEDNQLAGVVAHGAEFPTGHRQPPAHLGCRCHVVAAP